MNWKYGTPLGWEMRLVTWRVIMFRFSHDRMCTDVGYIADQVMKEIRCKNGATA